VLKWSFVLRIKFSAGRQSSASKSASSPSAKTLGGIQKKRKHILNEEFTKIISIIRLESEKT